MELSIILPARNEIFLAKTIENLLENIEADTEIIAVLDGAWADPVIQDNPRVTLIHTGEVVGQRAATNLGVKIARGKYVMKVDAHCAFDKGFDRKMLDGFKEVGDDVTMVPIMRNLWAFDWVCPDGHRRYQSPPGVCKECGKETTMDIKWIGKENPQSVSYCFDSEPHFQYFKQYARTEEYKKMLPTGFTESMSLQGSCFMCTKERYNVLNLCDESVGSWGNQGIEVACKTWLSGGRVLVNHNTWYAHYFRVGGIGFPYHNPEKDIQTAKKKVWDYFFNGEFKQQIHPVSWLLEKFSPPGWTEEQISKL